MKAGETPQLSEKWWSKNKAVTLGSTGLGKALKAFEVAKAKKDPVAMAIALRGLEPALKKAIQKCDKKKHAETLSALTKFPNLIVKEREEVVKQVDALAAKGVVVNMDVGDSIIDKAVKDIYKKRGMEEDARLLRPGERATVGKHSQKTTEDKADFSKVNDAPIVLLAHGEPAFGKIPSGAQQTAKRFADKKPAEIVSFLTKTLPKHYAGQVYLDGCYTAAGNSPQNFAKQVYDGLVKKGYLYLQVKGNLGVACTTSSGKELVSHAQVDNERNKLKKEIAAAGKAFNELLARKKVEKDQFPNQDQQKLDALDKIYEAKKKELDSLYIEALTGTFGPEKLRPKV
jgi:hypothetical protein